MAKKPKGYDDSFLSDWLTAYRASNREFESSLVGLTPVQLEELAVINEFRTSRLHRAQIEHYGLVLERFVSEAAFAELWQRLSEYDRQHKTFAFSAANGGVPATLLRRLDDWYRTPRFTPTQLRTQYRKIVEACDDLLHLLRQVTPGGSGVDRFDSFNKLHDGQARYILSCFKSPADVGRRKLSNGEDDPSYTQRFVQHVLQLAGITPLSAIDWIKEAASSEPNGTNLPTKVGAKSAMRTYFIHSTFDAINNASSTYFHLGSVVSNQHLADLVCLITNTDCNADDVRKALKKAPED